MSEDRKYAGRRLLAEYDSLWNVTELSARTQYARDALHRVVCRCYADARCSNARWTGSAWIVDGNMVAHVRNADAHWAGGRTTLARRIASALRTPARNECAWCGDIHDCRVAEVTEGATCAAAILDGETEAAEPAARRIAISLRPVALAAAAHAAHAVRSARARKGWATRRRNAARQAEALAATCEPLVTTADALPASVAYTATPSAELCHGRTAHGTDGRVVTAIIGGPIAEWSDVRHDYLHMAHTDGQYCETRGRRSTSGTVRPVWAEGTYWPASCMTMDEARRERRRARDAAWHREHRRLARERRAA